MALIAVHLVGASIFIVADEIGGLSVWAWDWLVGNFIWLSSVVLPVVGIDA
jgi:hypothetical protein